MFDTDSEPTKSAIRRFLRENSKSLNLPYIACLLVQAYGNKTKDLCRSLFVMDCSDPASKKAKSEAGFAVPKKPRVLLAACGSVAAVKFGHICQRFLEWAEVRAVVTKSSLQFIDKLTIPRDVLVFQDEHEWSTWKRIGDHVLHVELRKWADIMVIAPVSANTLGKIAGGLCDNLLTCIVRAWDYSKPLFVAPSMNTFMWSNPFTERQCMSIDDLGITLIPPAPMKANGEFGGAIRSMAEPSTIYSTVRLSYELKVQRDNAGDP
ncbi:hypothetical protein RJT34_17863 [Clitoria ternatea]|uniref:phosphopantothenoylcysteine decarboxylase n=1 Tax=Clitoria ternatea TaxID=43366 RepID=A0AAN9PDP2_CLITE